MRRIFKKIALWCGPILFILLPVATAAQADFNPRLIISDQELQDSQSWTRNDVQKFLDSKGSYLRQFQTEDASGTTKSAADIIFDSARLYQINPKYILVTLQKEQSLITDDSPTQKQLDWATGYGVCDGCYLSDPKVQRYKGFGKQVNGSAGIMRWYYNNLDKPFIKKKDTPIRIDNQEVVPQSWATAFLYTYTPHLHGNRNFWRIWDTWFNELYPEGTLLISASSNEYWLVQNGQRRHFKNRSALISRYDPKTAVSISDVNLNNYTAGPEISFANYSLLHSPSATYLLDYDTLRPFASDEVIAKLGYNPQELIDVSESDLAGFQIGAPITASTTAPQGVVFQISNLGNTYYYLKDNVLYPITDKQILITNFRNIAIEKHRLEDLRHYQLSDQPLQFRDGTLIQVKDSNIVYVIDHGKKRRIADNETFNALGYKRLNVITVDLVSALNVPSGEVLFLNQNLTSAKNKFLGDSLAPVPDLFKTTVPVYLIADYPSGRIIAGRAVDDLHSIASLTKLLTAYEALNQNFKLTDLSTFSAKQYGTEKGFSPTRNEKLKNSDLFTSMLVGSFNNLAHFVAQNTALASEKTFVDAINDRLAEWGADDTTIADVTGLSKNNQSTARDLLKIFIKVSGNKTIRDSLSKSMFHFRSYTVKNTNQLIPLPHKKYTILASKTGYTDEAGGVMIMLIEAKKTKKQYVVITLANMDYPKRFEAAHKLATEVVQGNFSLAHSP